ncbi:MAG: lipopolysaccharide heptosyltransferase II [Verrucomicrobiia bacterium]|jgi:heptosyltransferase-2
MNTAPINATMEKILIRSVNWIGDAVMSMPAISALRQSFPESKIFLLTDEKLLDIWMKHRDLDELIVFNKQEGVLSVARKLRQYKFDTGIAFPNSHRAAIEMWLGAVRRRIGYSGFLRSLFLTHTTKPHHSFVKIKKLNPKIIKSIINGRCEHPFQIGNEPQLHHIFSYLALVQFAGAEPRLCEPRIEIAWNETVEAKEKFKLKNSDKPLLGIIPGAEYGPAKRWLRDRFAQTAIELHKKTGCEICLFGGKADRLICLEISNLIKNHIGKDGVVKNLVGQTTLRELCAALKLCDLVVSNDTGPMHIAAAVGTPVIAIFGSTSPELTAPGLPGSTRHVVLKSNQNCSPCFLSHCPIDLRCMRSITVEQVVEAALKKLKEKPRL